MEIIVIAHNIRSIHNIGSIFRTCDGFGVTKLYLSGYSPYPSTPNDARLPHIRDKITKQMHKTALGAETTVPFVHVPDVATALHKLRAQGYTLYALEQAKNSVSLGEIVSPDKVALLLGEEVNGIEPELLQLVDYIVEIPMYGQKESFNVSVATGIALYGLREHKRHDILQSDNNQTNNAADIPSQNSHTSPH